MAKHAKHMLSEWELCKKELKRMQAPKLKLGLPPILGASFFPSISKALAKAHLLEQLDVVNGGSKDMVALLSRSRIDAALRGSFAPIRDPNFEVAFLGARKFCAVVPKDDELAKRESISFSELCERKFVTPNEHYIHAQALAQFAKEARFVPQVIYQNSDLTILKGMILEHIGIGFMVDLALRDEDDLVAVPFGEKTQPEFMISLVSTKAKEENPALREVLDHIAEIICERAN